MKPHVWTMAERFVAARRAAEQWRAHWIAKGNGAGVGEGSLKGDRVSSSLVQRPAFSPLHPRDDIPFDMVPDAVDLEHEARQLERRTPNRFFEEPEEGCD